MSLEQASIVLKNGDVRLIPKVSNIMDVAGILSKPGRAPVTLEDMEQGIAEGAVHGAFDRPDVRVTG